MSEKHVLFAHSTSPLPRVLVSQDTDHHQTSGAFPLLRWQSSLPSLVAVGGLCLEVSLGTLGPDPVLYKRFAIQDRRSFWIRKNHPGMGQAPTSQARLRDKDYLWPSNLTAWTLSLVEYRLSKFGGGTCHVRRGITAAVNCYMLKARVFLCRQRRETPVTTDGIARGFRYDEGKPVLFPFSCTINFGLMTQAALGRNWRHPPINWLGFCVRAKNDLLFV